jgi:ubiquinone/menaquinone biosynthesis C-methylase UbiE
LKLGSTVNLLGMTSHDASVPNHHAHYPHCSGMTGLLAAATMIVGRTGDARLAARLGELEPGDTIVDIGCGPGAAARYAAKRGANATGVDPSGEMLRVARSLTRSRQVRFMKGSAEGVALPDESADVVWTIASVHHWSDVEAGVREVRRLLRPGGRFIAIERHTKPGANGMVSHGWNDEQAQAFANVCVEQGLSEIAIDTDRQRRREVIYVVARKQ